MPGKNLSRKLLLEPNAIFPPIDLLEYGKLDSYCSPFRYMVIVEKVASS
jgi:hypothetical protein